MLSHPTAAIAADVAADAGNAGDAAATSGSFEPQLNPGLLGAALFAATCVSRSTARRMHLLMAYVRWRRYPRYVGPG